MKQHLHIDKQPSEISLYIISSIARQYTMIKKDVLINKITWKRNIL